MLRLDFLSVWVIEWDPVLLQSGYLLPIGAFRFVSKTRKAVFGSDLGRSLFRWYPSKRVFVHSHGQEPSLGSACTPVWNWFRFELLIPFGPGQKVERWWVPEFFSTKNLQYKSECFLKTNNTTSHLCELNKIKSTQKPCNARTKVASAKINLAPLSVDRVTVF